MAVRRALYTQANSDSPPHGGKPRTSSHSDFTGGKKELLGYSSLNVFNLKGRQAGFGYTAMDSDDPAHNVQLNLIRHIWAAAEYC